MRDVERVEVEVLECSKGEDNPDRGQAHCGGKDLKIIKSRMLVISLGNQSSLIVVYGANCIALHLKYPL